jgi:hypothetical protein
MLFLREQGVSSEVRIVGHAAIEKDDIGESLKSEGAYSETSAND